MTPQLQASLGIAALLLVAACKGDTPTPVNSSVARFEPTAEGPPDWGEVPFPSDLYLDAAGEVELGVLPTRRSSDPLYDAVRAALRSRRGFCATCNAYFPIDGGVDPESAALTSDPAPSDAIVIVDVDPASPERGQLYPTRVEWNDRLSVLAVRPARGVALRAGRHYAVALTSALLGVNGLAVEPGPAFRLVRDEASGGGAAIERARAVMEPALVELERAGVTRETVVSLAAFTTEDVTADVLAARSVVHAAPTPAAVVDRVYEGADIDDLLGIPSEPRAGIDVEPAAGTLGTRSLRHETVALVVTGRFQAPRLVEGVGTEVGATRRDETGRVAGGPLEDVPFMLTIPAGADLARLPVVISHHGFNASRTTGFVLADTVGRAGAAVLGIDAYQHGSRAESARDDRHAIRGELDGADGFAEADMTAVSGRVFGLAGVPDDMVLFPGYPLAAFTQFVSDTMAAVRFAREGDLGALRAAHPSLATLAFDPARVLLVGNSMGAVVGTGVLAAETDLAAVVLNVAPGSIIETLSEGAEFRGLTVNVFLPVLSITGVFDEIERSIVMDPVIDLFRWMIEPIDPLALAPYVVAHRVVAGPAPDVLWQLARLDEVASPPASESMVAAAEAEAGLDIDGATFAVRRFDPAAHGMLEESEQVSRYEPPLVPPLVPRAEPIPVINPIDAVHGQIEAFVRSRIETGRAQPPD